MNRLLLACIITISFQPLFAQSLLLTQLKQHITYLAADELEGRQTGSKGERLAYEYISKYYQQLGLKPVGDNGTYIQAFPFTIKANPHDTIVVIKDTSAKTAHNIAAYLDNGAATTVVIGAHYDHLGYAEYGNSLYAGTEHLIHNGADDNASGTAAVLELARILKSSTAKKNNYLFVNFSGEELGLYGSKYFVEHLPIGIAPINYMLNLDMVGRLRNDGGLALGGVGTSPSFTSLLNHLASDSFAVKKTESGVGPSDHTSFYLKNYPVLFFFTGTHSDYHKPSDDVEKINFQGEANVINYLVTIVDSLDNKGKLVFTKTKNEDNKETPKFKVTLGIMPDYVYNGTGIKIDGVSDGKPAAKAGMQTGDVIIALGKMKVTDMQSYMTALAAHKKGDSVKAKVMRDGKVKKLNVTF